MIQRARRTGHIIDSPTMRRMRAQFGNHPINQYGVIFWRCKKCKQIIFSWDINKKKCKCPNCKWRVGPKSLLNTIDTLQYLTLTSGG